MFLLMTQIYFQIHCLKSDVEQMVILLSLLQDACNKKNRSKRDLQTIVG